MVGRRRMVEGAGAMRLARDGLCHPIYERGRFALARPDQEQPVPMSLRDLQDYADGVALSGDLSEATRLRRELALLEAVAQAMSAGRSRGADEKEGG